LILELFCADGIGQASPKRPTAKLLDVDDTASTLNVCDDRNYVTKININKYFEYFPANLESKGSFFEGMQGMGKATEKPGRHHELEQNLCGDAFWRNEISTIARKLDGDLGTVYHVVVVLMVMMVAMVMVVMLWW
jgi:tetrahydromethanopterin S-methyltransferase subunit G